MLKTKRLIGLLMAMLMLFAAVPIPMSAGSIISKSGEVAFTVENAPNTVLPGDEFTVSVAVEGEYEAHILNLRLNYSTDAFEIASTSRSDVLNQIIDLSGTQLLDTNSVPGSIRLGVMMPTDPFNAEGSIFDVTFRVKSDAPIGEQLLDLEVTEFKCFPVGGASTPIEFTSEDAHISVSNGSETSEPTPVDPTPTSVPDDPTPPPTSAIWDFETREEVDSWTLVDADGDGYNWLWTADMSDEDGSNSIFSGENCMTSASFMNDGIGALTPDNWLISPVFAATDESALSFWYEGQDPSWCEETFGVYVTRDGGNTWSEELAHFVGGPDYERGTVVLGNYGGLRIQVAFRHYDVTDMFMLNLDLVELTTVDAITTPEPPPPTEAPTPSPTPAPIPDAPSAGNVIVILRAEDVYHDGTGYQMLLDSDATAYGNEIPVSGALIEGDHAPEGLYDVFEYKIPENADGRYNTLNIVYEGYAWIEMPAGVYDWMITNPDPNYHDILIPANQGNVGGRQDDYEFVAGNIYEFYVHLGNYTAAVDVTITEGSVEATPVPPTEAPTPAPTPQPGDVVFSVGGTHYAMPGETVTIDFTIDGEYEAHGFNVWLDYASDYLTIADIEYGDVLLAAQQSDKTVILSYEEIPGSIRLAIMCPMGPVTESGVLFSVTFTVSEDAEEGMELPLVISVNEFFNMPLNGANTPIAYFAENGAIVVGGEPVPPVTDAPETQAPETDAPETQAPETDAPVTDAPVTDAPTTDEPVTPPPTTGAISLVGLGVAAVLAGAGVVLFKKKDEE